MSDDLPPWLDGGAHDPSRRARRSRGSPVGGGRGGGAWLPWVLAVVVAGAAGVVAVRHRHGLERDARAWIDRLSRPSAAAGAHGPASASRPASLASLPVVKYTPASPPPPWSGPLPYPILIADSGDGRVIEVTPGGQVVWQYPAPQAAASAPAASAPALPSGAVGAAAGGTAAAGTSTAGSAVPPLQITDAAFSPDGGSVMVSAEQQSVVARIDYYARRVGWEFGVPGQPGGDATHLNYPDDAYLLPDGNVIVADIRNCRELTVSPAGQVVAEWGKPQTGYCQTDLAKGDFGYPNGDQPQADGSILMSFSSGDHIALLSATGKTIWDVAAPNLYGGFVSDAALLPGGDVLVAGYADPGSVVRFNPVLGVRWSYFVASGPGALSDPTEAVALPDGNVLVADGGNNRVVVIDPTTNAVVWQYSTGLHNPEGVAVDYYRDWQGWLAAGGTGTGAAAGTGTGTRAGARKPAGTAAKAG